MRKTWVRAKRGDKNLLIECACGCHNVRHLFDRKRRIHAYISGHNAIGKRSGNWKSGMIFDRRGCKRVWDYDRSKYIAEHRLIYERYYRCCLLAWIDIHHIDGNRTNNYISNLQPMTHDEHTRLENGKGIKAIVFCKGNQYGGRPKGGIPWNKGKPWPKEIKLKISLAKKKASV